MNAVVQQTRQAKAPRWQPRLPAIERDGSDTLSASEREAITDFLKQRSDPSRRQSPDPRIGSCLERLLRPLQAAFELQKTHPAYRQGTMAVMLRDGLTINRPFWHWTSAQWITVLGRSSLEFRARQRPRVSQSVRVEIAAIAYLYDWFRDIMALGGFNRDALARRIFGTAAIENASRQIIEPLRQWGYAGNTAMLSCLCEALLRNESPHLEHLTTQTLEYLRQGAPASRRASYYQLAKALMAAGILEKPLLVAAPCQPPVRDDIGAGVAPEGCEWIARWTKTSTLETRDHIRLHLYKTGRWLATHHPDVVSPAQWTRELAAQYVAAVTRMRVGDYTVRKVTLPRAGQPLSPRSMAAELSALRTLFWDSQEWGWIPRRFDPGRSLALPRPIKALIGSKPRGIDDATWARLLWAGLHLDTTDLPSTQGGAYPLEYVRALALVWLFAGLRSDQISRLRVGCVRWQSLDAGSDADPVCLLDVPTHKTGSDFTKPVEPQVGYAIAAWEAVRPDQPHCTDRKTAETVALLFMYRARAMRPEFINESLIPTLCRKAGVPTSDVRGTITSHRARATIASQLFNSREPMSLFELQAWLGHGSPASTQHYVAVTPTKLAKAYTDAGYFERNVRAIEVLIDQDTLKQAVAEGEPWRYYDLGHGLCTYEFFDQCPHRMACARCDFYRPRQSSLGQLLDAKANLLRFLQQIPLSDEKRAAVDGDLGAIDRLTQRLANQPTPSGQTPEVLRRCAKQRMNFKDAT
jgi:integrase